MTKTAPDSPAWLGAIDSGYTSGLEARQLIRTAGVTSEKEV